MMNISSRNPFPQQTLAGRLEVQNEEQTVEPSTTEE